MSEDNVERGEWSTAHIPPSWFWADFTQVFANVTDNDRKLQQKNYKTSGLYPVVDQGLSPIGGYTSDASLVHPVDPPYVVFGDHTRCVKMIDFPFVQGADGVKTLKPLLDPRYGYWLLQGIRLPDRGYSRHYQFLRNSFFPIAPLPEQHRIVAKIEELFSHLDAAVASLQRAKANLKRYRASVLKSAVEGRLTEDWRKEHPQAEDGQMLLDRILRERREKWEREQVAKFKEKGKEPPKNWQSKYVEPSAPDAAALPELPEGWVWATVHQLNSAVRPISYGVLQPGNDLAEGIPLVRVCDVADGRIALDQLKRIASNISAQFPRTILQGDEVLLTVVGTIGRTAIVPRVLAGANTARAVAVIAVGAPGIPEFLELCLREGSMRTRLTQASHEVARKTLNLEDVRVVGVPLPPLAEQQQIVTLVEERLSQIDAAEKTIDAELFRAKRLRQSILKRAFEGKLVPQDPSDEPVSVLLERITLDRTQASRDGKRPTRPRRARRSP